MEEENKGISYFTIFSWILVVWFYVWCLLQIWSTRSNFDFPDTWRATDIAIESGVVVFLVVASILFTGGYIVFISWMRHNYLGGKGSLGAEENEEQIIDV